LRFYIILTSSLRNSILSITDQFGYLVDVAYIFSSFVAIIAQDNPLSHWPLDQLIHQEKHDSEVVESLANELLSLLEGK
jgi:hypothetical protein